MLARIANREDPDQTASEEIVWPDQTASEEAVWPGSALFV